MVWPGLEEGGDSLLCWMVGPGAHYICPPEQCNRQELKYLEERRKLDVLVVFIANYPKDQLLNNTFRRLWIQKQLDYAVDNHLGNIQEYIDYHLYNCTDGVNFDFEEDLQPNSAEARAYTRLFKETVALFHQEMPGSQVGLQNSSLD